MALCPWLGSAVQGFLDHPVPVLIFGGQLDPTAPPWLQATVHYDITPQSSDKLLYEVNGGAHNVATNPRNANGDVGMMGIAWMKQYLLEETCHCPLLTQSPASASNYRTTLVCDTLSCFEPTNLMVDSVSSTSATLSWDAVIGADHLLIQGGLLGTNLPVEMNFAGNVTSLTVDGLLPGKTYEWQMQSSCTIDESEVSTWTSIHTFTMDDCEVPNSLFASDYTGNSVRLNWAPVDGATHYEIRGRLPGQPNWRVGLTVAANGSNQKLVSGIDPSQDYEWKIRSRCHGESFSEWSDAQLVAGNAERAKQIQNSDERLITIKVNPNPIQSHAEVLLPQEFKSFSYRLTTLNGQLLRQARNMNGNQFTINREDLPAGIYVLEVVSERIYREKLMVH